MPTGTCSQKPRTNHRHRTPDGILSRFPAGARRPSRDNGQKQARLFLSAGSQSFSASFPGHQGIYAYIVSFSTTSAVSAANVLFRSWSFCSSLALLRAVLA